MVSSCCVLLRHSSRSTCWSRPWHKSITCTGLVSFYNHSTATTASKSGKASREDGDQRQAYSYDHILEMLSRRRPERQSGRLEQLADRDLHTSVQRIERIGSTDGKKGDVASKDIDSSTNETELTRISGTASDRLLVRTGTGNAFNNGGSNSWSSRRMESLETRNASELATSDPSTSQSNDSRNARNESKNNAVYSRTLHFNKPRNPRNEFETQRSNSSTLQFNDTTNDWLRNVSSHTRGEPQKPNNPDLWQFQSSSVVPDANKQRKTIWEDTFAAVSDRVNPELILFISAANKNLNEDDFVRTLKKPASHRPFARVIPIRDPRTLQKQNEYMLIFHDKESLEDWRAHVDHLGSLSKIYTMRSLSHPEVPPQQDFSIKGEKIDQLVKQYAIMPAATQLQTNWSLNFLSRDRERVAQLGGYKQIVDTTGQRLFAVLLKITGISHLELADVLQSIMFDGKQRNMMWDIKLGDQRNRLPATYLRAKDDEGGDKQATSQRSNRVALSPNIIEPSGLADSEQSSKMPDDQQPSAAARRKHDGLRWVVYFKSLSTAQRFARTWHRRPLPLPPLDDAQYQYSDAPRYVMERDGGSETLVRTELLW